MGIPDKRSYENSNKRKIIYCSGPLFSPGEKGEMLAIATRLEKYGWETFLPQRDGIEALVMGMVDSPFNLNLFNVRSAIDRAIFALDVYQLLDRSDVILMNMNGRVPDEGALVEAAIAWAAGIPLVIYKNDARSAFKGMDNSMISGLTRRGKVEKIEAIPAEIEKAVRKKSRTPDRSYAEMMPSEVGKNVKLGERIWKLLSRRKTEKISDESLVKEIADLCDKY